MVMPATGSEITTVEQLLALPEDGMRHELLAGEHVVTPSPAVVHQWILAQLFTMLSGFLARHPNLTVLSSPADIRLELRDTVVQPDLFVFRTEGGNPPEDWNAVGIPVLAIEILSPGTASRDRGKKRELYQQAGVAEYWVVDSDARLVERWQPEDERPEVLRDELLWQPDPEAEGLIIQVSELFPEPVR